MCAIAAVDIRSQLVPRLEEIEFHRVALITQKTAIFYADKFNEHVRRLRLPAHRARRCLACPA